MRKNGLARPLSGRLRRINRPASGSFRAPKVFAAAAPKRTPTSEGGHDDRPERDRKSIALAQIHFQPPMSTVLGHALEGPAPSQAADHSAQQQRRRLQWADLLRPRPFVLLFRAHCSRLPAINLNPKLRAASQWQTIEPADDRRKRRCISRSGQTTPANDSARSRQLRGVPSINSPARRLGRTFDAAICLRKICANPTR